MTSAAKGTAMAVLLAVAVTLAGFGGPADANRGYVPSFSSVVRDKGPVFWDGCLIFTARVTSPPCRFGEVGSDEKAVVFGDSHALQWTPALIEVAKQRGWELTMLLRADCTAAVVDIDPPCNRWRRNALARIQKEDPALVFVASNTAPGVYVMRDGIELDRTSSESLLRKGMEETLTFLSNTGAAVTVMRDLPLAPDTKPSDCVARKRDNPGRCTFRASRPLSEAYDYAAAKRLDRVQIIDPLQKVCAGGLCSAVHGNILKYRDRGHISATYARTLAGWLDDRLQDPIGS